MSKQVSRGGIGSHKHGISGHSHKSSRMKQAMAREANDEAKRRARKREPLTAKSVIALVEGKKQ